MSRYLINISYDGSNYYGFQKLVGYPSIQLELETALAKIFKKEIKVKGAGRTDRGVHALNQGVSFDTPFNIESHSLKMALNRYLPLDIRVNSCLKKSDDFHARFSAKKKIYEYKINIGEYSPFLINYYYQPKEKIKTKRLKKVSKVFIGTHDFKNFVSGTHTNTISHIFKIKIIKHKDLLIIRIIGTHFYKYMIRNIVGAMLDYNRNKVDIIEIRNMLSNPTIKRQLTTISPNGLYLTKIYY